MLNNLLKVVFLALMAFSANLSAIILNDALAEIKDINGVKRVEQMDQSIIVDCEPFKYLSVLGSVIDKLSSDAKNLIYCFHKGNAFKISGFDDFYVSTVLSTNFNPMSFFKNFKFSYVDHDGNLIIMCNGSREPGKQLERLKYRFKKFSVEVEFVDFSTEFDSLNLFNPRNGTFDEFESAKWNYFNMGLSPQKFNNCEQIYFWRRRAAVLGFLKELKSKSKCLEDYLEEKICSEIDIKNFLKSKFVAFKVSPKTLPSLDAEVADMDLRRSSSPVSPSGPSPEAETPMD